MKKISYILILLCLLLNINICFADSIDLDEVSELNKYKYSGNISYDGNNIEDRNGIYVYKGSTNPTRYWVNWGGQWCFIKSATKISSSEYEIVFVENEWCLIQTSSQTNEYCLYEFDLNGVVTPETSNGYSINGSVLKFKANGSLIGSISDSKVKIKTYDDVSWLEYPEGSSTWFCGYNTSGNNFSFLSSGYAIIYEEDEGDYSLYYFNSDCSYAEVGNDFKHKSETYIKSIITSDINNNPAKFTSLSLPEDYEIDLSNWQNKSGKSLDKIKTDKTPANPTPQDSKENTGKYGDTQTIFYGGQHLIPYLNLYDNFEVYKGANNKVPIIISPSMNAQLILTPKPGELNNGYNLQTFLTDVKRVGVSIGESPMYLYSACAIQPNPLTGVTPAYDEAPIWSKMPGGYFVNLVNNGYDYLRSMYMAMATSTDIRSLEGADTNIVKFNTSMYAYWNSDKYVKMGLDPDRRGPAYEDTVATGWDTGKGIKSLSSSSSSNNDDSEESSMGADSDTDSTDGFSSYKCPNPNSHKKHEHKDTNKQDKKTESSGGGPNSSWSKSKEVKVERTFKEYSDGSKQLTSWKVTETENNSRSSENSSSSSSSLKEEEHSWEATGQLDCEGEFYVQLDKSNMDDRLKGGTELTVQDLVFENDEQTYSIPEQHGQVQLSDIINGTSIIKNPHIEGPTSDTKVDRTMTMQQWTLFGTGNEYGFTYPKTQTQGTSSKEVNDIGFVNVYEDEKIFYPHIRRRYSNNLRPTDWTECYTITHEYGTIQDNIVVQVAMNPVDKQTLHVDTVWDGWANSINGIVNTGVTKANGDDRDVVVDGGSTMFISTKNTPKNGSSNSHSDTDVVKMGVSIYINSCYGNEHSYSLSNVSLVNGYDGSNGSDVNYDGDDPLGLVRQPTFTIGDEIPNFRMMNRSKKGRTNGLTEAQEAIINFFNDMKKNLGHYRLEKVMAEGVFTQGQEDLFDTQYKVVSGINAVNTFGSFGQGNKSYNKARTEQTSNIGNKLSSDAKYKLTNRYTKDESNSNAIDITCNFAGLDTYWAKIDIRETNNKAYLILGKNNQVNGTKFDLTELKPLNTVQENKLFQKLKNLGQDWLEMEIATGWIRDILTSTVHNLGAGTVRPPELTLNGKGNVNGNPGRDENSNWYQEGTWYFFMTRGQAEYTLSLSTEKVEVMDPALCGLAENAYDIRNWNINEDESYTVNGVKIPLKNKVRTFRYQLSPYFSYNDDTDSIPDRNKSSAIQGDKFYLGTLRHPTKDKNGDYVKDEVKLDVYCQGLDFTLKSKLMYLTNATVQDNQK